MNTFFVDKLELHVAHACNLSCDSCSHYSNHGHKGVLGLDEAERWLTAWQPRLAPRHLALLGGEPTIHPKLTDFVRLVRRNWPETHIQIITNGWFLHKHTALPATLARDGNASILISVHHDSPEYRAKLQPVLTLANQWIRDHGVRIEGECAYQRWTRRYKGFGAAMEPYEDGAPELSWASCAAKASRQLHDGVLWKCAPLAYLGQQHRRYGLSEKWRPYLQYQPLRPDCSDEELAAFLGLRAESYCGMCPARPERFHLPLPFDKLRSAKRSVAAVLHAESFRASAQRPHQPARLVSTTRPLAMGLQEDPRTGWRRYPLLSGETAIASDFTCHASVLSAGRMPHAPHRHPEEELLIILDGEADLVIRPGAAAPQRFRVRPGIFVYYPAFVAHTIHNVGRTPASYLMLKWRSSGGLDDKALNTCLSRYPMPTAQGGIPTRSFMTRPLIEGPTRYLDRLHCHLTVLQPGAGYAPHADAYDIAIIVLQGAVETLGRRVQPHGVIYYAAGEPHGIRSVGSEAAVYLVFEFHGRRAAASFSHSEQQAAPADATPGLADATAGVA